MIPRTLRLIALIVVVGLVGVLIGRSTAPRVSPAAMTRQRQIDAGLDRIVPAVNFNKTPLDQAIDFLRKQTQSNISVNWRALEAAGVDRKTPVTLRLSQVSLRSALRETAELAGGGTVRVGWYVGSDGIIRFTTEEQLATQAEMRIYDVRDLIRADFDLPARISADPFFPAGSPTYLNSMDRLILLLTETVEPVSWRDNGGVVGNIRAFAGRLIVVQSAAAHAQIAELLDQLRNDSAQEHPTTTRSEKPTLPALTQ
jgi:hypothetical protein